MKKPIIIILLLTTLGIGGYFLVFYNGVEVSSSQNEKGGSDTTVQVAPFFEKGKNLEDIQEELSAAEQRAPSDYLLVDADYKKSFLGKKLTIEGKLKSHATYTNYKDPQLLVTFLDKNNEILDSVASVILAEVIAGEVIPFEIEVQSPRKTKDILLKVRGAEAVISSK